MSTQATIRKLLAQRERWLDIGDGRALLVRRPAETQIAELRAGVTIEHAAAAVVGWRGFTEAVLLGDPALGDGTVELPFAPELFAEWLRDDAQVVNQIVEDIAERVRQHIDARVAARGN